MPVKYKEIGTIQGGIFSSGISGTVKDSMPMKDAAVSTGLAFLEGELEKIDPKIRQPLSIITWPRDIPVKTGGGWVEVLSAMGVNYGIQGGGMEDSIIADGANQIPVIQFDMNKEQYRTHVFSAVMRINYIDLQRSKITGRSLEQLAQDGIRASYDKHMDRNTYLGFKQFGCFGLLNQPTVPVSNVQAGAVSKKTKWEEKTPDEILADINEAITKTWERAEFASEAVPNHILLPFKQYIYLSTTRLTELADETILSFLLKKNVAKQNGVDLVIAATQYAKGAGAGGADRMAVYVNNDRFIAMEELVPLNRIMTQPKTDTLSYDSVYAANISEVEVFYDQTISYVDGI